MNITPEQAKEAIQFLDSVAAKASGTRESHVNVQKATADALAFVEQQTQVTESQ